MITSKNRGLLDCIGETPLVRLAHVVPPGPVELHVKLEGNNPGGSVKDRAALAMLRGAIERGELRPGVRVVEPTSGNTGIGLAMVARLLGVELELVMPESATSERVRTMRAYGARVTLTPAALSMEGAIDHARELVAAGGALMLDQFANPDNPRAHYETTGPELWRDTDGRITHLVSAMGTTGTIMGTSRYLKEKSAAVQVVGVQPGDGACIAGIRRWPEAYRPRIFEPERVDRVVDVTEAEAVGAARRMAREEGIFCGPSGGGAVAAALRVCAELEAGVVVAILPDRGDRYLSSDVFTSEGEE
jgi:cysteine synthase B